MKAKRANSLVYLALCLLLAVVALLAFLNRGDAGLKRALAENREFQILTDGRFTATVGLQTLLDLDPQEFQTSLSTSIAAPRDVQLRGVELRLLLESLGISLDNASHIVVSGLDGYSSPLSREETERPEQIYICFAMDGEVLKTQSEGGFGPFLMVVRGARFAQRWCKYVESVDVVS